jgi:uncharacterized protein YbaR (Trm112 family)
MPISRELIEVVACPKCKGPVKLKDDESGFVCAQCRLVFPVVDEIPNFLVDEALPLEGGA